MLLFADSKAELHAWRAEVIQRLAGLRLTVHETSAQPRPTRSGVPFLGFQVFEDHRRLKRRKVVAARRRLIHLVKAYHAGQVPLQRAQAGILGWINHASNGDTWGLRTQVLAELTL